MEERLLLPTRIERVASRERGEERKRASCPSETETHGLILLFLAGVLFQDYELMKYSRLSAATTRPGVVETGGNETREGRGREGLQAQTGARQLKPGLGCLLICEQFC